MLLTEAQIKSANSYNDSEYQSGRLTNDHLAIAMASFQESVGLTVDGKAGPQTRSALEDANYLPVTTLPGLPEGKGMFIRSLSSTGSPREMVQKMKEAGITWVCAQRIWQFDDKESNLRNGPQMVEYAKAAHDAGFGFWIWGYPVPGKEEEFTNVIFASVDDASAEGIIIDPEAPYLGTQGPATTLLQTLMPGCIDRQILVGMTSYGAPWYHSTFPWGEFSTVHFAVPQNYDKDNNLGPEYPTQSHETYRAYGYKVIIPASGAWGKTEKQMTTLLDNTPTPQEAIIWWDWFNADRSDLWGPITDFDL